MIKASILLLLVTFAASPLAEAHGGSGGGVDVGNGGNVIMCANAAYMKSFDLVMADSAYGDEMELIYPNNSHESIARISRLLSEKLPELAPSFREFMNSYTQKTTSGRYIWKSEEELPIIGDHITAPIPPICNNQTGSISVYQAVIRTETAQNSQKQIVYHYVPELFYELSQSNGPNITFLLVHEWLWNLCKDVDVNRKVDYFLHSTLFDQLSSAEAKKKLEEFGFSYPLKTSSDR